MRRALTALIAALLLSLSGITVGIAAPAAADDPPAGPAAPTGLRVPTLAYDATSVTLAWSKPADHAGIADYAVYVDGHRAGLASANPRTAAGPYLRAFYADPANAGAVRVVPTSDTVTGLRPHTRYRFTVRSVDAAGVESADSAALTWRTARVSPVVDVTSYGAVGDGQTLDTAAIQAAIDACPPGGTVLVPAGTFLSGSLWLHSSMTFQVGAGGTLLGSTRAQDYAYHYRLYDYATTEGFYSLLNAHTYDDGTLHDIRVTGPGTIDGNGWKQGAPDADGFPVSLPSSASTVATNGLLAASEVAAATALGNPDAYSTRSSLITLRGVRNVYYGGFTALNPAYHTVVNVHSDHVTIDSLRLTTYNVNNADGVEFNQGTGLDVVNTVFDTGDDSMNFAAGLGAGSTGTHPTEDAWISGNYFRHGHGGVVAGSHTGAWIQDIVAEDNVMDGTDIGLRCKTNPWNGGGARRILFRDNALENVRTQGFVFSSAYSSPTAPLTVEPAATPAVFTGITVQHVTVRGTGGAAIQVVGVAGAPASHLTFDDVAFTVAQGATLDYLTNSRFNDVTVTGPEPLARPWQVTHSSGLQFTGHTTTSTVTEDANTGPVWPIVAALTATTTDTTATLSWPIAVERSGRHDYEVLVNGRQVATAPVGALSYQVDGLSPGLPYTMSVIPVDATGNTAPALTASVTTTGERETAPPEVPAGTVGAPNGFGSTWAQLSWAAATDNYGVDHYRVLVDGQPAGTVAGDTTSYVATGLAPATSHTFGVVAVDAAGNATSYPDVLTGTTGPRYDTGVPSWPHGARLAVVAATARTLTVRWPAATDPFGLAGYRLYVNGRPVAPDGPFTPVNTAATTTGTTYTLTGLRPGTRYAIAVRAGDGYGRWTGAGPATSASTRRDG